MKQPIITRDLERKAIYSDIIYDPEWLYVEITIEKESHLLYSIDTSYCDYDIIVDWGDGCIEKNTTAHKYNRLGTYIIRIKGKIICNGGRSSVLSLFGSEVKTKALLYGTKFNTNLPIFCGCRCLTEVEPNFFIHRSDLTNISYMFWKCELLTKIPDGLFDPLTNLTNVSKMFNCCYGIDYIPEKMFAKCPHIRRVDYMLSGIKLHKIPDDILDGLDELVSAEGLFYYSSLRNIPCGLFTNKRKLTTIANCFSRCDSMEKIPDGLFDDCVNLYNVKYLFYHSGTGGGINDDNTSSNLFSKCPNINEAKNAFVGTLLSEQKQYEIISNIGSYYKNK